MIETKDIKKMVAHIVRRDKGIVDTNIMHPTREWFIGLGITIVIVAVGTWFSFYIYTSNQNEMSKEVVIVQSAVPYNATVVSKALETFTAKQKKYNEILGGNNTAELPKVETSATTTIPVITNESETEVPQLIVDPAPVIDDEEVVVPTLAP